MTPHLQASKKKAPQAIGNKNDASPQSVSPRLHHLSTQLIMTLHLQGSKKKAPVMSHVMGNKGVSPPMQPARIPTSNDASSFEITLVCFCATACTCYD
jgi:hypothetical protein